MRSRPAVAIQLRWLLSATAASAAAAVGAAGFVSADRAASAPVDIPATISMAPGEDCPRA